MAALVAGEMRPLLFKARETVEMDVPDRNATSRIVTYAMTPPFYKRYHRRMPARALCRRDGAIRSFLVRCFHPSCLMPGAGNHDCEMPVPSNRLHLRNRYEYANVFAIVKLSLRFHRENVTAIISTENHSVNLEETRHAPAKGKTRRKRTRFHHRQGIKKRANSREKNILILAKRKALDPHSESPRL